MPLLQKEQIEKLLPHRAPFLLVDQVLDVQKDLCTITCLKHVKKDDWFFNGHFPGHPIMPGVLIIEALAQSAAIYAMMNIDEKHMGKPVFFVSIESAKFKKPVYPECNLILQAKLLKKSTILWKFECIASVKDLICTTATIMATIQT